MASRGDFTREDIVTALTAHHGETEPAFLELSKMQLKPFLMRIWGPPSVGTENEAGNVAPVAMLAEQARAAILENKGEGRYTSKTQ